MNKTLIIHGHYSFHGYDKTGKKVTVARKLDINVVISYDSIYDLVSTLDQDLLLANTLPMDSGKPVSFALGGAVAFVITNIDDKQKISFLITNTNQLTCFIGFISQLMPQHVMLAKIEVDNTDAREKLLDKKPAILPAHNMRNAIAIEFNDPPVPSCYQCLSRLIC